MPYWRLFYQIVWATKGRNAFISETFARRLHGCISAKGKELGALMHAVGGVEDHVHVAASVPPNIALSEFIRQLKGASSHFMNQEIHAETPFGWQTGYGVLSLDSKQLDRVMRYVEDQRVHHSQRTEIPILERVDDDSAS